MSWYSEIQTQPEFQEWMKSTPEIPKGVWAVEAYSTYKMKKELKLMNKKRYEELMKKFDLKTMGVEEMKEFLLFSGKNFSIANLSNCYINEKAEKGLIYTFEFKDGKSAVSDNEEMYNSVLDRKVVYDIHIASMKTYFEENVKYNQDISNGLQNYMEEAVETFTNLFMTQIGNVEERQNKLVTDFTKDLKTTREKFDSDITELINETKELPKKFNTAIKNINRIDIEAFNTKMKKLDIILEKFDEVLK